MSIIANDEKRLVKLEEQDEVWRLESQMFEGAFLKIVLFVFFQVRGDCIEKMSSVIMAC